MKNYGDKVTWPELFLVLESAEAAARRELKIVDKELSASDHWKVVDHAATEAAGDAVAPRELSPRELRLVVEAAEAANHVK